MSWLVHKTQTRMCICTHVIQVSYEICTCIHAIWERLVERILVDYLSHSISPEGQKT